MQTFKQTLGHDDVAYPRRRYHQDFMLMAHHLLGTNARLVSSVVGVIFTGN